MSKILKASKQTAISELHAKGWSLRRIALELGLKRRLDRPLHRSVLLIPSCGLCTQHLTQKIHGPLPKKKPTYI